jgi:tetratricopeptide (TPR) repeat protein
MPPRSRFPIPAFLLLAAFLTGCSAGRGSLMAEEGIAQQPPSDVVTRVLMAPFYFEGTPKGLDIYTDTDLFKRGAEAYDLSEWKRSYNHYRNVIDKFPDSPYRILSFYNAGLSLEKLGLDERALDHYLATAQLLDPEVALMGDVWRRVGALHERAGQWAEAEAAFHKLLARQDLDIEERWQAESRIAIAAVYRADTPAAIRAVEALAGRYERFLAERPFVDNQWLARAWFALGEVHGRRMNRIQLALPKSEMERLLNEKAEELLRAQHYYMRTLQIRNAEWATAAVYQIGANYEAFYRALNTAPLPPELNEEERRIYTEELRMATDPVRRKAIIAYDRIITFANELALRSDWVEKSRERIVELRTAGRFLDTTP